MGIAKSFLAVLIVPTLLVSAVRAQGKAEAIKFRTVDGVTIKGKFYPGEKDAPTVMILPNVGEESKKKSWNTLAEELQKKGYAVLTFDYRGHGGSTGIEAEVFWSKKHVFNYLVPGYKEKARTIENKYDKKYYPALLNDIAAAKAFLDRKNDAKECNSSRLVLIGAETGAALGAVWLRSEWNRYNVKLNPLGKPWVDPRTGRPMTDKPPEGTATICAIWLSISPNLGGRQLSLASVLAKPAREKAVPMIFMYSDQDKSGKAIAKDLEKNLVTNKKIDKYRFTFAAECKDSGKLKGSELLQKANINSILGYLDEATKDKGDDWMERDFRKSAYVWWTGFGPPVVAKLPDDMNLIFYTYESFMR